MYYWLNKLINKCHFIMTVWWNSHLHYRNLVTRSWLWESCGRRVDREQLVSGGFAHHDHLWHNDHRHHGSWLLWAPPTSEVSSWICKSFSAIIFVCQQSFFCLGPSVSTTFSLFKVWIRKTQKVIFNYNFRNIFMCQ